MMLRHTSCRAFDVSGYGLGVRGVRDTWCSRGKNTTRLDAPLSCSDATFLVRNYVLTVIAGTTTPVGASKPDAWVAVVDKQTQAEYFWNKESGVLVQLSCQQRR